MAEAAWEAASAEALELRGALSRSSAKASAAEALCERRGAELSAERLTELARREGEDARRRLEEVATRGWELAGRMAAAAAANAALWDEGSSGSNGQARNGWLPGRGTPGLDAAASAGLRKLREVPASTVSSAAVSERGMEALWEVIEAAAAQLLGVAAEAAEERLRGAASITAASDALLSELAAAEEAQAAGEAEARTLRSRLSVAALAAAAEGEVSAALRADLDRERARLKREFCAVHSALADEQASACALQFEMAAASQVCSSCPEAPFVRCSAGGLR
ncbi:hypothetical protein EMIHUDRAFT_209010 [Emiliania huxleyi CCMP1516]|uniref:Uncharacterized protein n=2 Tax=Emiliania huxleyi TaxID=2903 RepID=A0A0D3J7H9_EMIH1|nr:hypothetical protein EMIHUDRAFT_209010 [Emiliania huxleyi CCMP1516]EOD19464.1 hypothetical protein EMIHUDRAFT_209010 [Emiliania huxleyi CCMP1516]|eukprot:XP_005771893.1 hypothetical protein EMIHUDRAFT_209010 [Emiliania huxleyi CCMP1516]